MKKANFKDWTLTQLDKAFGLTQIWQCELLKKWENDSCEITAFEKESLLNFQEALIRGGRAWNEVELENKFISPLIMTAKIDDGKIGYFLERSLSSIVGDYELSGTVDGMIASGFREPGEPVSVFTAMSSIENQGSPDAQVLAAMLVAREMNQNALPIYGLFVVGLVWNFVVLNGQDYCISEEYTAANEDVFAIFKMLKALKQIIKSELSANTAVPLK